MSTVVQQLVNGLGLGAQYALWAVGFSFVYQVFGLMHFAHGDAVLVAVFLAFTLIAAGVPFWLVVMIAMVVSVIVTLAIERSVYRPLFIRGERFLAFVAALAAAFVLRNLITILWGVETRVFPADLLPTGTYIIGGIRLRVLPMANLVIALGIVILFKLYLSRGRSGQAILAVAQDRQTALLMGIPLNRIIVSVYAITGAIGAIGALMFVANFQALSIGLGFTITIKALVAAIIGGIRSVTGAFAGGILLGVLEALIGGFVSTVFLDAMVVAALIVLLVLRPTGLMGERELVRL